MSLPVKDYVNIRIQGNDMYRLLNNCRKGKGSVYTKDSLKTKFPILYKESSLFFEYLYKEDCNILMFNAVLRLMEAIKNKVIDIPTGEKYLGSLVFFMSMTDLSKKSQMEKDFEVTEAFILNWIENNC